MITNKFFGAAALLLMVFTAGAQTTPAVLQPYGKVDKTDLELKQCDFEKDANAEVLFDKATVYFTDDNIVTERHIRIKIFNDNGKSAANIIIEYLGGNHFQWIEKLQAQTINNNNGVPVITKVDKKQIFDKRIDKSVSETSFAFPDVKPGSIIEYKYDIASQYLQSFPDWYFQSELPTRYSEIEAKIPDTYHYKSLVRVNQQFAVNLRDGNGQISKLALVNVPSINNEPHMTSLRDNFQRIQNQLLSISADPRTGYPGKNFSENWDKVGATLADDEDFGGQFNRKISGEEEILNHVKSLKTNNEKIEYIFNQVKTNMKWNETYSKYTEDGTSKAWEKKIGNFAEVNLIVYHLLKKAGINALPMLTSTRSHGRANPAYPAYYPFNSVATYVPVDSATFYVLDATNKNNVYNVIPFYFLNSFGLVIDKENKKYNCDFIDNTQPARELTLINAEITADGKMQGTAQINSFSYNRQDDIESYKKEGEKKYKEDLKDGNNDLSITSLKMDNMEVDSLPLEQNINFSLNLPGSDGTYIYFKPNLFTTLESNPFLAENRTTDIDFGYMNIYSITGNYKIPAGYKVDALPKSTRMEMSDQTISFKRLVVENEGTITVRYSIIFHKSIFFKENYEELRAFYKKMYELIDEQVILKKG